MSTSSESDTRQVVAHKAALVVRWRGIERRVRFATTAAAEMAKVEMERIGQKFAAEAGAHTRAEVEIELDRLRGRLAVLTDKCCGGNNKTLCLHQLSRWTFNVAALLATHPNVLKDGDMGMKVVELH